MLSFHIDQRPQLQAPVASVLALVSTKPAEEGKFRTRVYRLVCGSFICDPERFRVVQPTHLQPCDQRVLFLALLFKFWLLAKHR